jgi:DNA invertase Pin-like site-specific DNA recombinase
MTDSPLRAALYLRISLDQTGEQLGVTRQREDCEALCEREGWAISEVYTDNDTSANKNRPGNERMLADIEPGHIKEQQACTPDRIYRRILDLEHLITVIEKNEVMVRTVKQGDLDLSSGYGRMIARILGSVASGEGEIKSERWKRSVRQRREAGAMPFSGPRMKGWERDGTLIPEEAAEIRWMADQILNGSSLNGLTKAARDRGITSTLGKVMSNQSVKRLLLNPRLAGYATLNGEIVGKGTWPAILEPEVWENVKALLTVSGSRPTPARVATLAGLTFCGNCGARMVSGSRMKKNGGLSRTYRCTRNPEGQGCMKVSMAADIVEEVVESYAYDRLNDPRVRERIDSLRAVPKAELSELTSLQDRLVELEHQLDEPGVPVAAIVGAMERTKARIGVLSDLVSRSHAVALPSVGAPWPEDVTTRRSLVALVVDRVVVQPSTRPGLIDLERIQITER